VGLIKEKSSMSHSITLLNRTIPYTLKINPRSKRVRLAVYPDASFIVSAPRFVSSRTIEKFIVSKADSWCSTLLYKADSKANTW
jgi:predicted metal-dependent hydrolase